MAAEVELEELLRAESRARDAEAMMMQAAEYGKDLLEKNIELEASTEASTEQA